MIAPHGGTLVNCVVEGDARTALLAKAEGLAKITLNSREASDLEMIATGAMSPLNGFMGADDYNGVCDNMHLANGVAWPLPVVLSTKDGESAAAGDEVALVGEDGSVYGVMTVSDAYQPDKAAELTKCYQGDAEHRASDYLNSNNTNLFATVSLFRRWI